MQTCTVHPDMSETSTLTMCKSLVYVLALTQTCECVLLAVVSIYPHHSLRALPGLVRLHKHRGRGHGCSFTSLRRTSKSLLLTEQMNARCLPGWYMGPSCCLLTVVWLRRRPHHGARAGPFVSFSCISKTWLWFWREDINPFNTTLCRVVFLCC